MVTSEPFLYTGQSWKDIPPTVIRVKVDPSVRVIGHRAFKGCNQLIHVDLCEGMLEHIDVWAFENCTSLERIDIPSTVKVIGKHAFSGCRQLVNVELSERLENIEGYAFRKCTSLRRIRIPSTVKYIHNNAFDDCTSLVAIEFCDEIEQLVNEATFPWWNNGVSEVSLMTYSFLTRCNIPFRLDTIKAQPWKINIHDMLRRIPDILEESGYDDCYGIIIANIFNGIKSRLVNYEHLQEVAPFLELALWKAKITEQQSNENTINVKNDVKLMCRVNSFSMFDIIFPNVFSFLSGDV